MPAQVRVAVIGCGEWGGQHLRVLKGIPGAAVVALIDVDQGRRREALAQHPSAESFARLDDALAEVEIDAVVIATPAATHAGLVERALGAGKHVLCEKPLCLSSRDAIRLTGLAGELGLLLLVGHTFLLEPGLVGMKEALDRGTLGALRYVTSIRNNVGPIRCDIGVIHDLVTHDVAILNWLLGGPPVTVRATGVAIVQRGIEDVTFASLDYGDGRPLAQINASWLEHAKERRITCVGSQATAVWDPRGKPALRLLEEDTEPDDAHAMVRRQLHAINGVALPHAGVEPLRREDDDFIEMISSGGQSDLAKAEFNIGVVSTIEALYRSFQNAGELVRLQSDPVQATADS